MPCSVVEILCVLKNCTASSALKMEAALFPPQTFGKFLPNYMAWYCRNSNLHSHCHGNLKSCRTPVLYRISSVSLVAL